MMKTPLDLQSKKAHFARMRRSNYAASLRLEGFDTTPADGQRPLPTREAVLQRLSAQRHAKG